jgi:brefeldin A-inhibited guanine nucleotide-exchange protein
MAESDEQAPVQPELKDDNAIPDESQDAVQDARDSYEQIATDARDAPEEDDEVEAVTQDDGEQQETAPPPPPPKDEQSPEREEPTTTPPVPEKPQTPSQEASAPTTAPDTPSALPSRSRTDSQSTTATNATRSTTKGTRSSMVFVVQALESIAGSKDARKRKPLADSTQRALSAIRSAQGDASQINPEVLFEPLNLATEASTVSVVTTALDCIGKLISYSYFSAPPPAPEAPTPQEDGAPPPQQPTQQLPLIERAIDTICESFQGEATPAEMEMQIIKSLLAAVLNDKIVVHGAGLLKCVRQTYNIFLQSRNSANQQIAQGTVTQMVGTVFERVKTRLAAKTARVNSSHSSLAATAPTNDEPEGHVNGTSTPAAGDDTPTAVETEPDTPSQESGEQRMTLQTFETRKSFDDSRLTDRVPTTVTRASRSSQPARPSSRMPSGTDIPAITVQSGEGADSIISEDEEEDEIYVKDAFLVFRAMCKLSTKSLRVEEAVDMKSQGMRSKLLSLHIIHTVLFSHATVFTSPHATIKSSASGEPTGFTQAVKQYLCLSLSRNGASSVQRVFEVSAEIFSLMLVHLRSLLKRELEVFLKEIYLAILEKRAAPSWQKQYIVNHVFNRLAQDPKVLVEIYLNYDCDRNALDNMFQRIIEHVSRVASQPVNVNGLQERAYQEYAAGKREQAASGSAGDWREKGTLPPSLATANMGGSSATQPIFVDEGFPQEYAMKMQALECLVEVLRSLVRWGQQGMANLAAETALAEAEGRSSTEELRESIDTRGGEAVGTPTVADSASIATSYMQGSDTASVAEDDPAELEKVKARKTALNNAIRQFNFKPKRGLKLLLSEGFIPSSDPKDIGRFLLSNERLNKKSLGEFLGEGDEENIKIMHAFVESMDFTRTRFVDALRRFLQAFRLPGEAQKIDRLMLKFAERYTNGNPNAFANADTAYVLGYSVIMLNTDQHSIQVKNRMTPEDFIKNNRGINDNANLPDEYLTGIYDEIREHEIVLDTEREAEANLRGATTEKAAGLASVVGNLGRDLQREAYAAASEEMSNRTEQLFRSLLRAQKRGVVPAGGSSGKGRFLTASSFRHVGPMFEVTWMGFLTALSGTAQETQNLNAIRLCMEGQKMAVRIACLFDLQDPRQAFVGSLGRSTNLYNLSEMKAKNVEALYALLDVAYSEGNLLKESWREVLTCISQLDRFQLISSGVEEGAVPDVMRTQTIGPGGAGAGRKSTQLPRRPTSRAPASGTYQAEIAEESRSADMVRGVDRIFTNTANLSGDAIVHFVRALTQVSWQEIQSSGQSDSPRTYSLQKLVEISGYNMLRVRFEWTNIWQVLGQHFIEVGCHNNTHVVYFALNSLRQLSMRFMEIEELPGFKFQKDFLKPFELILANATQVAVKDMVLRCLIQMIQARGDMIRSGWRTMFGVFTVAAKEPYESIVNLAFDNVTQVYNDRFGVVISQGAFADLVVCLTEFSKNMKFQKKSLQAIETLRSSVPKMLRTPECPLSQRADGVKDKPQAEGLPKQPSRQTQEEQYWFPVLFAFHDVLMTGEDLEVRSRALNYLFDTLTKYGGDFPRDFWDTLWRQLLYPIFMVLKDRKALNQDAINHEELSVWLSTTLIQALRNMITLFTHFFDSLEYMLDRFLDLLALCICQENDTLARIGSNCLQQLILQNVKKFSPVHWEKIVGAFVDLFARTEAKELFSAATSGSYDRRESSHSNGVPETPKTAPGDDTSSISSANALKINGLPPESSAEVSTVNGDSRPATLRTETSNSLALSDETERSHSPIAMQPSELEDFATAPAKQQATVPVTAARRRYFNQIITKCVLQLLMIETVSELFNNDAVYASIPSHLLLRLMALLKKSYHFAKRFNDDRDLRTRLFREGFMKQPPNLLKQESGSASVYVLILLRMYADTSAERAASRPETEAALIPLCRDIIASYVSLDEETQQRNIATWRPVVIDVLEGYNAFPDTEFGKHVEAFAPLAVGLMGRDMGPELQRAVQGFWGRVCEVRLGVDKLGDIPLVTPTREREGVFGRRGSRAR